MFLILHTQIVLHRVYIQSTVYPYKQHSGGWKSKRQPGGQKIIGSGTIAGKDFIDDLPISTAEEGHRDEEALGLPTDSRSFMRKPGPYLGNLNPEEAFK